MGELKDVAHRIDGAGSEIADGIWRSFCDGPETNTYDALAFIGDSIANVAGALDRIASALEYSNEASHAR